MSSAWSQLEQLLTCAICLDRYRNPKLLPCHHTYCQEPCLDGLVDYARRQIKCPECRAEHRIPYQGVQTLPTNVTLVRFLELHRGITGEEPEPVPSMMERCGVCSEKSSVERCAHCEKKICTECKEAHLDILRRELTRINSQVRRALTRLQDSVSNTEKNCEKMIQNQSNIRSEVEEIVRRYVKDLKDKETRLIHDLDEYALNECRNLNKLKEDLAVEATNINSNCDLIEKHVLEQSEPWTDSELVEYKDIFQKTLDFLRNFDPDTSDYARRIRFVANADLDVLRKNIANFGELKLPQSEKEDPLASPNSQGSGLLALPQGSGLMRSQSDHRLAAQFAKNERARYLEVSGSTTRLGGGGYSDNEGRGERATSPSFGRRSKNEPDRYGRYGSAREEERSRRDDPYRNAWPRPDDDNNSGSHFKSRFMRDRNAEAFEDEAEFNFSSHRSVRFEEPQAQAQIVKVFDTTDAPRGPLSGVVKLMDTSHLMERLHQNEAKGKVEKARKEEEERVPTAPAPAPYQAPRPKPPSRQVSEDEIEKQKLANKAAEKAAAAAAPVTPTTPVAPVTTPTSTRAEPLSTLSKSSVTNTSTDSTSSRYLPRRVTTLREETESQNTGRRSSDVSAQSSRRGSDASSTLDEAGDDADSDSHLSRLARRRKSSATTDGDALSAYTRQSSTTTPTSASSTSTRSLRQQSTLGKKLSIDSISESPSEARRRQRLADQSSVDSTTETTRQASSNGSARSGREGAVTSAVPYHSRFEAADHLTSPAAVEGSDDGSEESEGSDEAEDEEDEEESESDAEPATTTKETAKRAAQPATPQPRAPAAGNESADDETHTPYSSSTNKTTAPSSRTNSIQQDNLLASGRRSSTYQYRTRDRATREEESPVKEPDTSSAWSQYLRTKYGSSRTGSVSTQGSAAKQNVSRSKSSHALYATRSDSSDDEDRPSSLGLSTRRGSRDKPNDTQPNNSSNLGFSFPRSMYLQKRRMAVKVGTRGTEPSAFTWPRGVAVGPDNSIAVADSSNHRVQVFDSTGRFLFEFGGYGSNEGEFDCLAGVAVNRIGQFIVSDRYNHRIQIFDPSGKFLRAFGSEGRADGKFSYPWGITTDSLGFIYVCDKENHRIQVFQSDGTFVGKFGSIGSRPGQLEHPHYIAVSNTNRVIVSDSNNHRIQIFDVNGRSLSTFGSEGSEDGQFKFPRGVAVDDQGYIIVGDSGNNRIQVFNPDGSFLKGFGAWGSGDGEFKGLEGVAVSTTGNILVCDRENHRIQVF